MFKTKVEIEELLKERIDSTYTFPNVQIMGTSISCGLQPMQLSNGLYNWSASYGYTSYRSYKNLVFGLCYFSKHVHLHHRYDPNKMDWYLEDFGGKFHTAGSNQTNHKYYTIDPKYGYMMSASAGTLDEIEQAVKEWKLGDTYRTPNFKNKKYSLAGGTLIGVLTWHWNGHVPKVSETTLNFPYDDNGKRVKNVNVG